jgi:predicted phosphodiesterase
VLIFGHSHIPWNSHTPAGLHLVNPGSPTDRRRQPAATFLTADLIDASLQNIEVVELPARTEG